MKTCFWYYDKILDVMICFSCHDELFDVMTCFCLHDKMFKVMTYFWLYDTRFDIMTYFFTSWQTCDVMTNLWTSWCVFDVMTHFVTPWRTWWRHDKLGDVITLILLYDKLCDIIVFFTSCQTFRSNDELFEVMMKLLTSWRTFWHDDVSMTLWRMFDVTNYLMSWRMLHLLTSQRSIWRQERFDNMTHFWHPDTLFDLMTNFFTRFVSVLTVFFHYFGNKM